MTVIERDEQPSGTRAMIGVSRAAVMFFADIARWTSAKLVVQ